jgi:hypothetical protein
MIDTNPPRRRPGAQNREDAARFVGRDAARVRQDVARPTSCRDRAGAG